MATHGDNCSYGKKCTNSTCTKSHQCFYFKKNNSCTKTAEVCKFVHGSVPRVGGPAARTTTAYPPSISTTRSPPPPPYAAATAIAQAFEDGLTNPVILGVSAAAAEDSMVCPGIESPSRLSLESITRAAKILESRTTQLADIIAKAQQLSVCFVMDTTGSMSGHISAAKKQVSDIVSRLKEKGCQIMAIAFVGYKDWCDGDDHFEVLPFTSSITAFQTKLDSISATGGGDLPEDVLGGLAHAVKLQWPERSGSRLIFHIGDAPPHGSSFHDLGSSQDSYFAGHPKDMAVEEIFEIMKQKRVEYFFGEFGHGVCNKMKARFGSLMGRDPSEMTYDVTNTASIADSVTASALKVVTLSVLRGSEKTSADRKFSLDGVKPTISALPEIAATSIAFNMPDTVLACCDSSRPLSFIRRDTSLRIAPRPFSKGASRLAYYGASIFRSGGSHAADALHSEDEVVLKEFIKLPVDHKLDAARYFADLEAQTIASKLAMDFSEAIEGKGFPFKLKYLKATLVRIAAPGGQTRYMAMEKLYRGGVQMVKYTNNHKFVNTTNTADKNWSKKIDFLLAFSHFTYVASRGYLVVTDLQGISGADIAPNDIILTDPAIHCAKAPRFGATNLMKVGISAFINAHVCSPVCAALKLGAL